MFKKLIEIANKLDSKGLYAEADLIDLIIKRAIGPEWKYHGFKSLEDYDKFKRIKLIVDRIDKDKNKLIGFLNSLRPMTHTKIRHNQDAIDPYPIPGDQLNIENQGYIGGDGVGGGYSGLHAPMVGQPSDDMDNVDMVAGSNGIIGNSVLQNAGFSGLSDAYFYQTYGNLEGNYGPQDR